MIIGSHVEVGVAAHRVDRADRQPAVAAAVRLLDEVVHPVLAAHAQRFERAPAHLDELCLVVVARAQRAFDLLPRARRRGRSTSKRSRKRPRPERRLAAHERLRVAQQSQQHGDQVVVLVLPERLHGLRAHLHVVVDQPRHEDGVEVQLDVVLGDVRQPVDDVAPALDAQRAPDVQKPVAVLAVERR